MHMKKKTADLVDSYKTATYLEKDGDHILQTTVAETSYFQRRASQPQNSHQTSLQHTGNGRTTKETKSILYKLPGA